MILLIGTRDPAARLDLNAVRNIAYDPAYGFVESIEAIRDKHLAAAALVRIKRAFNADLDFSGRQADIESTLAYLKTWMRTTGWNPVYVQGVGALLHDQKEGFSFWDEDPAIHTETQTDALGGLPVRVRLDGQGMVIELPWGWIRQAIAGGMSEPFVPAGPAGSEDRGRVFETLARLYAIGNGVRVKMVEVFETE